MLSVFVRACVRERSIDTPNRIQLTSPRFCANKMCKSMRFGVFLCAFQQECEIFCGETITFFPRNIRLLFMDDDDDDDDYSCFMQT